MSFVEGIGVPSIDVVSSVLVVCVSTALLLIGMLVAIPAVATTLRLLRLERFAIKFWERLLSALHRPRSD